MGNQGVAVNPGAGWSASGCFVDDRQGDNASVQLTRSRRTEPTRCCTGSSPSRRAVAGHRGDLHAAQDLSDGGEIQARSTTYVEVIAEDVIAGRRGRQGGIALGLRRARETAVPSKASTTITASQEGIRRVPVTRFGVRSISQNNPIQYHRLYGNTSADSSEFSITPRRKKINQIKTGL